MKTKDYERNEVNRKLIHFFLFTFLFSWLMWLPGVLHTYHLITPNQFISNLIEMMNWIGGVGPSLIAFILAFKSDGKQGAKQLFGRILNVKLGYWYFPIFIVLPVILLLAHIFNLILFRVDLPQTGLLAEPWWIPVVFLIFIIMQISEEFGWRGYALNFIQKRWNALMSSLIIGVFWAIWHIPMFLSRGFPHYEYHLPFLQLFVTLVVVSIIITWFQNNCKGSLIPAFVIHAMINISGEILPLINKSKDFQGDYSAWILVNILFVITAILILVKWGYKTLKQE